MAGELRAKLVAENRRRFGNTEPQVGEAIGEIGEHLTPGHIASNVGKEYIAGKGLDKGLEAANEALHPKIASLGNKIVRGGVSNMGKALVGEKTKQELAKVALKSGAQKIAGRAVAGAAGKLVPVLGQIDAALGTANTLNEINDWQIANKQKAWDSAMNGDWEGTKHDMMINMPSRPLDSPTKGKKAPNLAGAMVEGVERGFKSPTTGIDPRALPKLKTVPNKMAPNAPRYE